VVLASLFAERWRGGVCFAAVHPGWVDTPGLARSLPRFRRLVRPILRDPGAGADTVAWLLEGDAIARHPGAFWHDRRVRAEHRVPWTRSTRRERERFWEELVELARDPASSTGGGSEPVR
jgi:NAD(P)-dependent dehydrogenase (short-subunit alcohol dehydrogenase family)